MIDVGINRVDDEAIPKAIDCLEMSALKKQKKADFITPFRGVHSMTIAMLMQNTVLAAKLQHGLVKH